MPIRHSLVRMKQSSPTVESTEDHVRQRIRSLRVARGWTLDELAKRSFIGPSTISRIETGGRRIALDQLVALAKALGVSVDDLLDPPDTDVVIRPVRDIVHGMTIWPLTRGPDAAGRMVSKMRIPASNQTLVGQIHPGRDWFFVLSGTARLLLGEREVLVEEGHAAEFNTMIPHAIAGFGGPVELIVIFDRDGERTHLH